MAEIITEYPQFFTATNLSWNTLLQRDKYKDVIIESYRLMGVLSLVVGTQPHISFAAYQQRLSKNWSVKIVLNDFEHVKGKGVPIPFQFILSIGTKKNKQ